MRVHGDEEYLLLMIGLTDNIPTLIDLPSLARPQRN